MAHKSYHPELDQPLPRRVKASLGFYTPVLASLFLALTFGAILGQLLLYDTHATNTDPRYLGLFFGLVGMSLGFGAFIVWTYFREKNLLMWGTVVEAIIVEGPEYSGRGTRYNKLEYGFDDADGNSITGTRLFTAKSVVNSFAQEQWKKLEHPVAIYDPQKSKRHLLYPASVVNCCLPDK